MFRIIEKVGDRSHDGYPKWYQDKVKTIAEAILKKKYSEILEAPSITSESHNDICDQKELIRK